MQGKSMPLRGLFLIAMMVSISSQVASGADTTVQPRAYLRPTHLIQEGEMVTFDARDSDAIEGIITASMGFRRW